MSNPFHHTSGIIARIITPGKERHQQNYCLDIRIVARCDHARAARMPDAPNRNAVAIDFGQRAREKYGIVVVLCLLDRVD